MTAPADRAVKLLTREMRRKLDAAVVIGPGRGESVRKRGWENLDLRESFKAAMIEMAELYEAISGGDIDSVKDEAADVANYMAFIVAKVSTTPKDLDRPASGVGSEGVGK